MIIADSAEFTARNLKKIGYAANPLEDGSLEAYQVHALDLSGMAVAAVKEFGLTRKDASRSKNMFTLGLLCWMFNRPIEGTVSFLEKKFATKPEIRDANITALRAGHAFGGDHRGLRPYLFRVAGEAAAGDLSADHRERRDGVRPGRRGVQGGGCRCSSGAYPITPASDVLHELSKLKRFGGDRVPG